MAKIYEKDYMKLMQEAAAKGDYKTAAQYEQQRNDKIANLGLDYDTTSNYAGWLDTTDYGTVGKQQMAAGADWRDVKETYDNRYNKAAGTVGLQQYANDDVQKEMWDYITANMQNTGGFAMPSFNFDLGSKPTYTSNYQTRIDDMLNQILSREAFSYDVNNDPLYQQYATQYNREGNRAMNDTLAAAASGAGGMNSYAVTAAQQANNYYATQLNDKIPELYQLAYSMYLDDIDQQVRDLGLLQDMDNNQYNRYRDTMSDWRNDRDFAYGQYRDGVGDYKWKTEFDYNAGQDSIRNDISYGQLMGILPSTGESTLGKQEFDYGKDRDKVEDARLADQDAWDKAMDLLNSGAPLTQEQLEAAGLSSDQAATILAWVEKGFNLSLYGNADGRVEIDDPIITREDSIAGTGLTGDPVELADEIPPKPEPSPETTPTFSTYDDAAAYLKKNGISVGGLMTKSEWSRRKSSYEMYGQGGTEVVDYKTYEDYLNAYVEFNIEKKGK